MNPIRTMIIDDERASRNELKRMLAKYPDFELVAEAADADAASEGIRSLKPDLLFLDIQMPEKSGFDLLEMLEDAPVVVFTTAFDQYAIRAFEISALDYLLKPIRQERFDKAITKIRERINNAGNEAQIFVKDRHQYHFIRWSSVYLVESADNYCKILYDDKNILLKGSLSQLEERLNGSGFFRINRSQLVGRAYIRSVETMAGGRLKIILHNRLALEVSERQSVKFKTWASAG